MSQRRDTDKVLDDEEEEWEKMEDEEEVEDLIPRARRSIPFDIKPDHFSSLPPLHPPTSTRPAATTSMETATDKQGKKINEEEEEEEEKAKQVSKEGNSSSSSSIPLEETSTETEVSGKKTATETEGFGKTTVKPFGKGNVVDLPFKKLTIRDDVDIISESKPGESSEREIFLFEVELTRSDVEGGRLSIPTARAILHFPPMATVKPNYEQEIIISDTDTDGEDWKMLLNYNRIEHTLEITRGWLGFVDWHNLRATDVVRFYRPPFPRLHNRHFLIKFVKNDEPEIEFIHEFKQENFLFQLQLTSRDIGNGVLFVPEREVRNHFPAVNIPAGTSKIERLTFTDTQNTNWGMKIHFDGVFMITHGWDEFVNEHHLEAMDTIKFYKAVWPLHHTHFLIECVKREGAAGTSQTHAKDGKGGCRRYRFGRKKGGGGGGHGGGSSHDGGRRGKWNTMCCWTWKNQPRGRERAVMILEEVLQVTVLGRK